MSGLDVELATKEIEAASAQKPRITKEVASMLKLKLKAFRDLSLHLTVCGVYKI